MKTKRFDFRVTERRYDKLTLLAKRKEKSVASLFDDWIDSLPDLDKPDNLTAPKGASHSSHT